MRGLAMTIDLLAKNTTIMARERDANLTMVYVLSYSSWLPWGFLIQNGPKGYDTTRGFEDNTTYTDPNRQHDWSQDRGQEDRSRGVGGPKKRLVPSEPSPHVIFLGLDPDFTEADVCRLPCS